MYCAARAGTCADILEAFRGQSRGFERVGEETPDNVVVEEHHAADGVVDHEKLFGAEELVADDERPDGVVEGAAAGVAYDVSVAFGEAGISGGFEASVHAGENGETARRWKSEAAFLAEAGEVLLIGKEDFVEDIAHG